MISVIYARKAYVDDNGIKTLADIKAKKLPVRMSTNTLGNLSALRHARFVLEAYGFTEQDVLDWGGKDYHLPDTAGLQLLQDGKLDMIITMGFHPDHRVMQASRGTPIVLLPMDQKVVEHVAARQNTEIGVISKGTYPFLEEDYYGATYGNLFIVAGPSADDLLTYKVAKALYEDFDRYRRLHPAFESMSINALADSAGYPIHPGAERLYREVGMIP